MQRFRLRFNLRQMMVLVVFMALVSAVVIQSTRLAQREREIANLVQSLHGYQRAADRKEWAERMYKKGYVSKAALTNEEVSYKKAADVLGRENLELR
jgi:hypothetical protein